MVKGQLITHKHDTHVLVDDKGTAVLSGSEAEMRNYERMTRSLGGECEVRKIDAKPEWRWEGMDWGD